MRYLSSTVKILLVSTLLLLPCFDNQALAKRKQALIAVADTSWLYTGEYKIKAKKTGLNDIYGLEFIVDFFDDGTFALQDVPIDPEADFFSGTWFQNGNKIEMTFDQVSKIILTQIFEEELSIELEDEVDVVIEKWELTSKLKIDKADVIFIKFKEKLRHLAIWEGIYIRHKTKGKGEAGFFEEDV